MNKLKDSEQTKTFVAGLLWSFREDGGPWGIVSMLWACEWLGHQKFVGLPTIVSCLDYTITSESHQKPNKYVTARILGVNLPVPVSLQTNRMYYALTTQLE